MKTTFPSLFKRETEGIQSIKDLVNKPMKYLLCLNLFESLMTKTILKITHPEHFTVRTKYCTKVVLLKMLKFFFFFKSSITFHYKKIV